MNDDGLVGRGLRRREDGPLLTGDARFTDDLDAPGAAHLVFVRSQYGHARIESVDTAPAEGDGVLGVFTQAGIADEATPMVLPVSNGVLDVDLPGHPVLARDRVRYQGQPVAAVVAEDRPTARDAAGRVDVTYDPLEPVVDPTTAAEAPALFESAPDNVVVTGEQGERAATDRAFAAADRTVTLELENQRLIPSALEPRAALARPRPDGEGVRVEMTSQAPHRHREKLATTLGLPERRVRVVAPDVGGGFGHKGHHYPGEAAAARLATLTGRPVKWTATRTEGFLSGTHGRDHHTEAALAVDDDATVRGLRARTTANAGGYVLGSGPALAVAYGRLLAGQYRLPAVHCRTEAVLTNTAPVHAYRGAGRPEAIYVLERLMDAAARELDVDPVELRRHNLIPAEEFPYETPTGVTYDSGDYERTLERALEAVGYEAFRERQARAREEDRYLGVGVSCYLESTGEGFESGLVRVHPDGGVTVYAGTHSHGQGHATTYAQVVADELGVEYDDIEVVEGDTERVPTGTGTFGSRSAVVGGNAVAQSARDVARKVRRLAADRLETAPEDLRIEDGSVHVAGAPGRSVPFGEVASLAYAGDRPAGMAPGLEATTFYETDGTPYTFGCHAALVEVDPEAGEVEIDRYVAVDDCGTRLNPRIVEGQVHGGVAQGIGQALYERASYDDSGNLATGSMQDYAVPKAVQLPEVETHATVTESPHNPLGVKGIGEAGTIAAPPAVVNAAVDALAPFGVEHIDMPLTAETVWRTTRD
jgi:carbon-monoxide dehydrogenase large subunit